MWGVITGGRGLKTFSQVLEETDKGTRHLLLGNGFSRSWNDNIFSYENLLDKSDFGNRDKAIKGIFEKLGTYDFEEVMQTMVSSVYVAQSFNEYPAFVEAIYRDAECLKNSLLETIAKTHPNLPTEVSDKQYISVRTFLLKFSNIFTVNYDLLLYWARNMRNLEPRNFDTDDGFRSGGEWTGNEPDQNVFFLHGGLHLYDEAGTIKKHTYTEYGGAIIDQVRGNLNLNKFPIFVAEPSHIKKLDRIRHNPYLNYCYEQFGKIEENLVILGHSMNETDSHIFNQAASSGVKNVYVSLFGNQNSQKNRKTKSNAESYFNKCAVHFYNAESVQVWE